MFTCLYLSAFIGDDSSLNPSADTIEYCDKFILLLRDLSMSYCFSTTAEYDSFRSALWLMLLLSTRVAFFVEGASN